MKYIDSHVHFWDPTALAPYTWLHEVPAIGHRHDDRTLHQEAGIDFPAQFVFVEAGAPPVPEVEWVSQLARREPNLGAIVAKIFIDRGEESRAAIQRLRQFPLVRGVRDHFEHAATDHCARPAFIAGVRELAGAGLSFDICCKSVQLPAVLTLVRSCPDVQFVLDHGGKPAIRDQRLDPWRAHITELAASPNVVCKLSGLVTEAAHDQWTPADLAPYVEHLLASFGPERLMFGSDWPVAKLASGYRRWLNVARDFTRALAPMAEQAIFHDTAARVYRLTPR